MNINERIEMLYREIEKIFEDPDYYGALYRLDQERAIKELKDFGLMKDRAIMGNKAARNYVINHYVKVLIDALEMNEVRLEEIISFKNWKQNDCRVLFEILLNHYDISELIEKYLLKVVVNENDIRHIFSMEIDLINQGLQTLGDKIKILATLIYAYEDGQDVIDTLQHQNINEIGLLAKDYIYIVYKGKKIRLEFLRFPDDDTIINIQKKTTRNSKVQYDEQNPTIVASKDNASRITVAGYTATASDTDLFYNERIFNLKKITLEEMQSNYKTINELIYKLIVMNQKGRGSYLVSGADMGVGKSTFLAATIEKVPDYWGIGLLDSQDELQIRKKYPWKNVITLIENPKRSITEQFQTMLKMARDVLFVGEITKPEEICQLINSCLRLNSGVGGTIHLISPLEAVSNCRNLLMSSEMYDNSEKAEEDIARGIDLVFHLGKLANGNIIVEQVVEICYLERNYPVTPLLNGPLEDRISNMVNMAQVALSKYLYQRCYHYNEIIRYDRITGQWIPVNLPSENYYRKINQFVSDSEIKAFKAYFSLCMNEGGVG